jgi:hypothetical protein
MYIGTYSNHNEAKCGTQILKLWDSISNSQHDETEHKLLHFHDTNILHFALARMI